jgi:hypothetical protein
MSYRPWPNAEERRFLVHAIAVYRTSFMGPYNIMGMYTVQEFWLEVYNGWYDHFPVPWTDALEEAERRVSGFCFRGMILADRSLENQELDSLEGQ